jgi:carboxyl-terminal processing protease
MLSFLIVALIAVDAATLILSMIGFFREWLKWCIPVLGIIALLHLIIDGFYQTMIPVYAITGVLIALCAFRWKRPEPKSGLRVIRIIWAVIWRLICVIGIGLTIWSTWSFGNSSRVVSGLLKFSNHDYSNLGWSEAFDEMSDLLEKDYAFGEWKAIDWKSLHDTYGKEIAAAEKANDTAAYCLALRKYVFSLPDDHVEMEGNYSDLIAPLLGGFGFAAIQMDDGRVVTHILEENSPAADAGIKWGAEIITWDNLPVQTAIDNVSVIWELCPPATNEALQIKKLLHLTRAEIGTSVSITFRNPDETEVRQVSLTAFADKRSSWYKAYWLDSYSSVGNDNGWKILPNGYGYIQLTHEYPIPFLFKINPVGEVRKAVKAFIAADVPGVILDLRNNGGGIDEIATRIMSFFVAEPLFYEQIAMKDSKTGEFKITGELSLEPSSQNYTGPVAMLVSNNTKSTGEGFPLIMQSLNRGPVLGFYGTAASFGQKQGTVIMPEGYSIGYPNGAALDADGNILLDSDYTLNGGVHPDITVPINMDTLKALYVDGKDVLLEEAIAVLERNSGGEEYLALRKKRGSILDAAPFFIRSIF